ncbi:MAG: RNA methyltransferase [Halobacteria archaeon]
MNVSVAVVDAETPGNLGAIARSMKNFGFRDLLVVEPPSIEPGGEAYGYAAGARDVLEGRTSISYTEMVDRYYTVGFTSVTPSDDTNMARHPFYTAEELPSELPDTDVALVFGREAVGLSNRELELLDGVCTIPANPEYPALNLSQAATVALYEISKLGLESHEPERETAPPELVEEFYGNFSELVESRDGVRDKDKPTTAMRRILGRANPTEAELKTLMTVFGKND